MFKLSRHRLRLLARVTSLACAGAVSTISTTSLRPVQAQELEPAIKTNAELPQITLDRLGLQVVEDTDGLLTIKRTSAASDRRIEVGDRIVGVDGQPVVSLERLNKLLADASDSLTLKLMRGEKVAEIQVAASGETPTSKPVIGSDTLHFAGMTLKPLEVPALVTEVDPKSAAWDSGVREGDRLLSVDNIDAESFKSLSELISASMRDDERLTVPIRVAEDMDMNVKIRTAEQVALAAQATAKRRVEREREAMSREQSLSDGSPGLALVDGAEGAALVQSDAYGATGSLGMAIAELESVSSGSASPEIGMARIRQVADGLQVQLAVTQEGSRFRQPAATTRWAIAVSHHGDLRLYTDASQPTWTESGSTLPGSATPEVNTTPAGVSNPNDPRQLRTRPAGESPVPQRRPTAPPQRRPFDPGVGTGPVTPAAATTNAAASGLRQRGGQPIDPGVGAGPVAPETGVPGNPVPATPVPGQDAAPVPQPGGQPIDPGVGTGPIDPAQPATRRANVPSSDATQLSATQFGNTQFANGLAGGPYMTIVPLTSGPNGRLQAFIANGTVSEILGRALVLIELESSPNATPNAIASATNQQDSKSGYSRSRVVAAGIMAVPNLQEQR